MKCERGRAFKVDIKTTSVAQIQRECISLWAADNLCLSGHRVNLAELGGLSGARVGQVKRGRASVKCHKKAGRFPTLQLVGVVYDQCWGKRGTK